MALNSKANLDLSSLLPPSDTPNGDHKCPMDKCGKAFESLADLTRHNSICHPYLGMTRVNELPEGVALPFACPIPGCCRSFETQYSVNSHLKQTHMVDPWKDPAAVQAMIARYNSMLQQNGPQAASSSYSNCLQPNGYVPNSPAVSGSYSMSFQPNRNLPGVEAASASYSNSLQPNAYLPGTQAMNSSYVNIQPKGNPGVVQSASSNKPNNNQSPRLAPAFHCPESDCGRAFDTAYGVGLHHKQVHRQEPYRKPRNGKGVSSKHSTKTASSHPGSFGQSMGQGLISNNSTQAASNHPLNFSQSLGQNVISQSALPGLPLNFDLRNFNPDAMESISRPKNNAQTKNSSSEMDATFPYQCHVCQVHDRDYETYYEHMTQAHPFELGMLLQFRCFVEGCNRSFEQRGERHGHVEEDHPGAKLKCPACSLTYMGESGLWLHFRREHLPADEGLKYNCHHCTSSHILPSDLKRHTGLAHGEWGCTSGNCEWYFGTSTELNNHWIENHGRKAPVWVFNSRNLPKDNPSVLPPYRMLGDRSLQKDPIPFPQSSKKSQTPAADGFGSPINHNQPIGSMGGENSFMAGPSGSHNVSYASPKSRRSALPVRDNSESAFYSASGNPIKSEFQTVPAELGINEDFGDGNIQFAGYDYEDPYGYPQYPGLGSEFINDGMEMGDDAVGDLSMPPVTPPDRRGLGAPSFTMPPSSMPENEFDGTNSQKGLLSMATRGSVKKPRKFGATDFANLPLEDKEVDINEWFENATAKCAPEDMRYYSPEPSDDDESVVEETRHRGETCLAENGYRVLETMKYHPDRSPSPFYPRSPNSLPKPPSAYTLSKLALPDPPKIVPSKPTASKVSTSKANTMSPNGNDLKPSEEHIEPMKFVAGTNVPGIQRRGRGRPRKRPLEDTMPAAEPPAKKPTVSSKPAPKQVTAMESRRGVGDFDRPRVVTPQPKAPITEKDRREALGLKGETGRQKIRVVNSRQVRPPTSIRIKDSRANIKPPKKPTVKKSESDSSDDELDDDDEYVEDMFGGLVKKPTTNSIANLTRHAANVAASAAAAAAPKGKEKESRKSGGKR